MNPRKNKILCKVWLTQAELESMKESLKDIDLYADNILEILDNAQTREDFEL